MPTRLEEAGLGAWQASFAGELLHGDASPDGRRLSVYRNNIRASLVAALTARFPVIARLVGEEYFTAMALVFIARHPPSSPVVAEYGETFADFLGRFEPAAGLPYLPDVARLEWARQRAFHAADRAALSIERLTPVSPERLENLCLKMHPAAAVVASEWPIHAIWSTNTHDDITRPIGPDCPGGSVLVTRPELEVLQTPLPPGAEVFMAALADCRTLGEAASAAAAGEPGFDLALALSTVFGAGAIADLFDRTSP